MKEYAKQHCSTLLINPSPNLTNYWQTIDLNVGRLVRGTAYGYIEAAMDTALEAGIVKWSAPKKREECVKAVAAALVEWRKPERQRVLQTSCDHSWLSASVSGLVPPERTIAGAGPFNLSLATNGKVPLRFPDNFAASVMDTTHHLHADIVQFDPFAVAYRRRRRTVAAPIAGRDANHVRAPVMAIDSDADVEEVSEEESNDMDLAFPEDEDEDCVVDLEMEEEGMAEAEVAQSLVRCCLEGCVCELDARAGRCGCKAKFGGVCLESCGCRNCGLGEKKSLAAWRAEVAAKPSIMIPVDTAVRLSKGEELLVVAVLDHEIDDDKKGVQFHVEWVDGDTTWERLEQMTDIDNNDSAIVNDRVLAYATALKLDMALYLRVLVEEREASESFQLTENQHNKRRRRKEVDGVWRGDK